MEEADRYRCRYVYLKQSSDPARQATAACEALADIDGILLAAPHDEHSAHIVYSLDDLSFEIVIDLLSELDFEMDNSFLISLRNTIYCYLEDNARDHMPVENTGESAEERENPEIPHRDKEQYWDDYH
jgi:hypothetical protein